MDFVKVQGLGNDFLVFDGPFTPSHDEVRRWCDRRMGVGADGVLVIAPSDAGGVTMRYWNADGSEAEMCGNGLRCVARLAYDRGWVDAPEFVVQSAVGDHPVVVKGDVVRAFVGTPQGYRTDTLKVADQEVHPLSIGNPHAVLFVDDVDDADVEGIGPRIENDAMFPDRTNVEFVQVVSGQPDDGDEDDGEEDPDEEVGPSVVRARIWERGVGETMASGTGATASAYMAYRVHGLMDPITVQLLGGDLVIDFDESGAWMEGPTAVVFSGSVS